MDATPLLEGTRLRLTALTTDDLPVVVRWHQDPGFLRMYDARPAKPRTEGDLREWIEAQNRSNNAFLFAIQSHESELVGLVEIDGILWAHGVGSIAYCIGVAAERGKGYGTEAGELALAFAFHEINLHRMEATVFSYNRSSIRLLERHGFVREGVHREFLERNGQRHDMLLYGLLRREWEASR